MIILDFLNVLRSRQHLPQAVIPVLTQFMVVGWSDEEKIIAGRSTACQQSENPFPRVAAGLSCSWTPVFFYFGGNFRFWTTSYRMGIKAIVAVLNLPAVEI